MSAGPVWSLGVGGVGCRSHTHSILSTSLLCRASLLHKKAICAVHSLLCSHDADRYAEATVKPGGRAIPATAVTGHAATVA